jgi:hypothetical protein
MSPRVRVGVDGGARRDARLNKDRYFPPETFVADEDQGLNQGRGAPVRLASGQILSLLSRPQAENSTKQFRLGGDRRISQFEARSFKVHDLNGSCAVYSQELQASCRKCC